MMKDRKTSKLRSLSAFSHLVLICRVTPPERRQKVQSTGLITSWLFLLLGFTAPVPLMKE